MSRCCVRDTLTALLYRTAWDNAVMQLEVHWAQTDTAGNQTDSRGGVGRERAGFSNDGPLLLSTCSLCVNARVMAVL